MSDTTENTTVENPTQMSETEQPMNTAHVSFSIWPPTQRTRDAVTARLVETLSTPSILSKRYGTMNADVASDAAKRIEAEAFEAAGVSHTDGDGMEVLQAYSKEISKRMLDAVKNRSDGNGNGNGDVMEGDVNVVEETEG